MYAWHWTHRGFFWKKVALAQWSFLYKWRCLFKEALCFDVLECESASSSLPKLDAVWMNGRTGHFHGWLPSFSVVIIYPYVFWGVYLDVTTHYAKRCWGRKWSANGFSWPRTGRPLPSIGWPACLPPCWPDVGAKWARCWILQHWPSTSHVSALPPFDKPVWKVLKCCCLSSLSVLFLRCLCVRVPLWCRSN